MMVMVRTLKVHSKWIVVSRTPAKSVWGAPPKGNLPRELSGLCFGFVKHQPPMANDASAQGGSPTGAGGTSVADGCTCKKGFSGKISLGHPVDSCLGSLLLIRGKTIKQGLESAFEFSEGVFQVDAVVLIFPQFLAAKHNLKSW